MEHKTFYSTHTIIHTSGVSCTIKAEWLLTKTDATSWDAILKGFFPFTDEDEAIFLSHPLTEDDREAILAGIEQDFITKIHERFPKLTIKEATLN